METVYFSVGVLTMVLLAVASLAVYSTVMVLKLKDEIKLTHKMIEDVYGTINHISREQSDEIADLRSYADRRFDKLIDTYLLVKETEKESKKLIKG